MTSIGTLPHQNYTSQQKLSARSPKSRQLSVPAASSDRGACSKASSAPTPKKVKKPKRGYMTEAEYIRLHGWW